jgi:hypothetical protein
MLQGWFVRISVSKPSPCPAFSFARCFLCFEPTPSTSPTRVLIQHSLKAARSSKAAATRPATRVTHPSTFPDLLPRSRVDPTCFQTSGLHPQSDPTSSSFIRPRVVQSCMLCSLAESGSHMCCLASHIRISCRFFSPGRRLHLRTARGAGADRSSANPDRRPAAPSRSYARPDAVPGRVCRSAVRRQAPVHLPYV